MQSHGLTQGLTFTEEDMQTVRQGVLTAEQCDKLRQLQQRTYLVTLGCAVPIFLGLACIGAAVYSMIASSPISTAGGIVMGVMALLMVGVFVLLFGMIGFQVLRFNQDLVARQIESITGPARIVTVGVSGGSRSNYVEVNGVRFATTTWLHQLEEPGAVYRVYYLPRSRVLVTVERAAG